MARRASAPAPSIRHRGATQRHALIEKLKLYVALNENEIEPLAGLLAQEQRVPRDREIVIQGRPYRALYVLNEGLALRYKILSDGRRQVLNLVVPGDLIGLSTTLFETAIASVSSLTDVSISPIQFKNLFDLFRLSPRLAAALFWVSARESGIYAERLAAVGRRTAYERLAHLVLELLTRLQAVGKATETSFEVPLTQEMFADALGLSIQHVNRMIRNLREEGLAAVNGHLVTIHDMEALIRLAGFESTYLVSRTIPGLS